MDAIKSRDACKNIEADNSMERGQQQQRQQEHHSVNSRRETRNNKDARNSRDLPTTLPSSAGPLTAQYGRQRLRSFHRKLPKSHQNPEKFVKRHKKSKNSLFFVRQISEVLIAIRLLEVLVASPIVEIQQIFQSNIRIVVTQSDSYRNIKIPEFYLVPTSGQQNCSHICYTIHQKLSNQKLTTESEVLRYLLFLDLHSVIMQVLVKSWNAKRIYHNKHKLHEIVESMNICRSKLHTVPRQLVFYCAAVIKHPRIAAQCHNARMDQEEQFTSRKTPISQVIKENKCCAHGTFRCFELAQFA